MTESASSRLPRDMIPHPVLTTPPDLRVWKESIAGAPYVHERAAPLPGPDILLTALVHGNEYSGAIVLDELLRSNWLPQQGRVTVAFCNVEAFGTFDARTPDSSRFLEEDFNRVWSRSQLDGPQTSVELRRARELLPYVQRATHLLDLHSMHEPCAPLFVSGLLSRNIAFAQALRTDAQVVVDAGHADGTRMRDHDAFNDPEGDRIALLLEAGQHWEPASVSTARNAVMRFLAHAGVSHLDHVVPGWLQPARTPPPPVHISGRVVARSMDFVFTDNFTGGEVIPRAGSVIAFDAGEPVRTPHDDCVLVMPSLRQLRPGVTTVRFGQR